jgi:trigger factor
LDASKLQVSLEEGERWRRTLSITVPSELVQAERQAAARKLSGRIKLPGFRKGKVPPGVVEKQFGRALDQEVRDRVIEQAYRGVLQERGLRPISEGDVENVDWPPDSDLTFRISFDVAPQVEFSRLGGFKVERPSAEVPEDEVEQVLERIREQEGTWHPVEEGKPEDGDMVSIRIERLEVEGDEPRPYELTLGKDEAIPDVEAAIRSLDIGSSGDFDVAFPDDFPNEERRGQSDRLRIFLDGRKVLERPELSDDFARSLGDDFESLEALTDRIRTDLREESEARAEAQVRGTLLENIIDANPFQVPDSMIDHYVRTALGGPKEISEERLAEARSELGPQAEYGVKRFIVIQEVARAQGLAASDEEIDARIEEMAERSGTTAGEVYSRLQKSGRLDGLEQDITERKVFDFLKEQSEITQAAG